MSPPARVTLGRVVSTSSHPLFKQLKRTVASIVLGQRTIVTPSTIPDGIPTREDLTVLPDFVGERLVLLVELFLSDGLYEGINLWSVVSVFDKPAFRDFPATRPLAASVSGLRNLLDIPSTVRARQWLRHTLNLGKLTTGFNVLRSTHGILDAFYVEDALVRSDSFNILAAALAPLEAAARGAARVRSLSAAAHWTPPPTTRAEHALASLLADPRTPPARAP